MVKKTSELKKHLIWKLQYSYFKSITGESSIRQAQMLFQKEKKNEQDNKKCYQFK